jgi:hypothetical protein
LIALLCEAFAQGEKEGTERQEDTSALYEYCRVRKPWRTAHIDACDNPVKCTALESLVPTDDPIFGDYCKLLTPIDPRNGFAVQSRR